MLIANGLLDQSWSLSLVGDWNSFTEESATQSRTHGDAHEVLTIDSVSVTHDATGNVTLIPSTLRASACGLEWDFDNRLSAADTDNDSTADIQFGYDALGRRVQKGDTVYAFDGWQVIAQYESGNSPSIPDEQYVYASYVDEPILKEGTVPGGTGIVYYHRNQQYSVVALTDDQGEVVERYAYDPHGNLSIFDETGSPISATAYANPYTWTGREFDAETGLYYFRARYFDPAMGRFLSRDPLGYVDGMGLYRAYFAPFGLDSHGTACCDPTKYWHHLLPWAHADAFAALGIDINQPSLRWDFYSKEMHQELEKAGWGADWDDFWQDLEDEERKLRRKISVEEKVNRVEAHLLQMLGDDKYAPYWEYGEQATRRYPAENSRKGFERMEHYLDNPRGRKFLKLLTALGVTAAIAQPAYGACGGCDHELNSFRQQLHLFGRDQKMGRCQDAVDALRLYLECIGNDDAATAITYIGLLTRLCTQFGA